MILVIGDQDDVVITHITSLLRDSGIAHAELDTAIVGTGSLRPNPNSAPPEWRVVGGDCRGKRPVKAVFVRRGRAATPNRLVASRRLWAKIDRMLVSAGCLVINRPSGVSGNYAKVHQLKQLASAGFTVPETLVTSMPRTAMQFIVQHGGRVLVKGISSVKTLPQAVGPEHLASLGQLLRCPAQFQEIVVGREWRVTVVGQRCIASTALPGGGYRHSDGEAVLPRGVADRCRTFLDGQGLVLGGFDMSETRESEFICFEMNPNPLVTHYDMLDAAIGRALCDELCSARPDGSGILA